MQKIQRARRNGKRGPFSLSGGVQVHLWGDWLLVAASSFRFKDRPPERLKLREWGRAEFAQHLHQCLGQGRLEEAPFWVGFSPERNGRNTLVPAGPDVSWPSLSPSAEAALISGFKLLERWRDGELRLSLAPLWQESE